MKEGYRITKAENGYFIEVFDEENNIRRVVCTTDDELRALMTKTLFAELRACPSVNVNMEWE